MDLIVHDLRQTLCLQHLEGKRLCHTIPPGEEPAKGVEDFGELCKVHLTIDGKAEESVAPPFIEGERSSAVNADATFYCEAIND